MNATKWNERFDILNRNRLDGYFTLELYEGSTLLEKLDCNDFGFFSHGLPDEYTGDTGKITISCFNRNGNTYKLNTFVFSEKIFYLEYKEGFIFNDAFDIAYIFRHSNEITKDLAFEAVKKAFSFASDNINIIFQQ